MLRGSLVLFELSDLLPPNLSLWWDYAASLCLLFGERALEPGLGAERGESQLKADLYKMREMLIHAHLNGFSPPWKEISEPAHSSATVKFHFNVIKIKTSWLGGKKPQMLIQLSGVHLLCSLKNKDVAFWRDFRHRLEAAEWQGQRLNTSLPPEQVQEQQQLPPHSPSRSLLEFAIPCDVELLPGEVSAWKV